MQKSVFLVCVCACMCVPTCTYVHASVCVYEPVIGTVPSDVKDTNWMAEGIVFIIFLLQLL